MRLRRLATHAALASTLLLSGALTACGGGATTPDATAGTPGSGPRPGGALTYGGEALDQGTSGDAAVDPRVDPASTFALDVDDGSFRVARGLLDQGYLPARESVRPEEWINAFSYDDPAPTDADLAVRAESATRPPGESGAESGAQLVRVAVTARDLATDDRAPVNLTLVVDRSGSMAAPDKLGLVQSSLRLLADGLQPTDTIAVVSFDSTPQLLLPPTAVGEREQVLGVVDELTPGGSTDLGAGLELGYAQARSAYREGGVNVVVLCSDGVANVGLTGADPITSLIAEEGRQGIHLVTVGYGLGDYNDTLMEQLADRGDGFYRYVNDEQEARHLYVDELAGVLTPVADDARAQVTFDPERVSSYRLVGYEDRAMADQDFDDLSVDAGELGAGHRATALYEVRLVPGVAAGDVIGLARVRWVSSRTRQPGLAEASLVAADPSAPASDSLALSAAVADVAALVENGGADTGGAGLAALDARVAALVERGVPGADDLSRVLGDVEALS